MNRIISSICAGITILGMASAPALAAGSAQKTVAQIYLEKAGLNGKQVVIEGKVVKVNNGIMKRNFLHIQDGTGQEGSDDITITSDQTAGVGDTVTVTGTLAIDRDFGSGYTYPVIIEQATITKPGH